MKARKTPFELEDKKDGCCFKGCSAGGDYPAPKSPYNSKERYHFCLDHVKIYNKSWDFFSGMEQDEIEGFYIDSVTGHRRTFKRDATFRNFSEEELREKVYREFNFTGAKRERLKDIPDCQMKYMKVFGLTLPVTMRQIKNKYKELAKKYHPDVNGKGNEEKFKQVTEAYNYLKNCGIK
ncbi:MAG: hypothetical protein COV35_01570 [Alphaproteobacteria bacterium CG11_big_fil_rev_8_21_14_0_20_39_49]|nr:MAG: hypothetical protein COV35_01570 [Alphaproteobacteria bacterium CG11_big_fil_rev_8_21_14_0_20_39_49]